MPMNILLIKINTIKGQSESYYVLGEDNFKVGANKDLNIKFR